MSETRSGYRSSMSGLVGALLVSFVLITAIWGLTRLQHRDPADPVPTVDYPPILRQARDEAPFPVLAPKPVPPGWRATSASWDGAGPQVTWHLGFLTATGGDAQYVGLDEGNEPASDLIAASTRADQPGPPVRIGGVTWTTMTSADGRETALVLERRKVTTIVSGTASESVLAGFAASLAAGPP